MVSTRQLTEAQLYALTGLQQEVMNEYLDPNYITEKLNIIFHDKGILFVVSYIGG